MPTTLERTTITHTPRVQHLLDAARSRWPDERSAQLLINLAELGAQAVEQHDPTAATRIRREQLKQFATETYEAYGHAYDENYLAEVREGW
ncbi:MAG: hypothetical protein FWD83_01850 [Promicromonosporaceae bacterium]|nr:hypothetical protein [Promicromonosporaceae bacterium]